MLGSRSPSLYFRRDSHDDLKALPVNLGSYLRQGTSIGLKIREIRGSIEDDEIGDMEGR